jgi:uncharacterized RDD family membrane protein YckC
MDEFALLKSISHPIRARVIELLSENIELPYSEILRVLKIDSGQLNFHLRNMEGLITKGENGNYLLTRNGKIASTLLKKVRRLSSGGEEAVEPTAAISKRCLAALIDFSLFLFSPLVVVFIVSYWIPFYERIDPVTVSLFLHAIFALTLVVFVAMESYNGQTLGKFALGIRVIKENGRKPNLVECLLRNVAKVYFLPMDVLLGVLLYKHKGYLRFSDYFTKVKVVDIAAKDLEIGEVETEDVKKIAARR